MSPFNDPFNPFAGVPGDPMEEVLALQSYAEPSLSTVGSSCGSNVSCPSNVSCESNTSGRAADTVLEPNAGFAIR